MAWHPGIEAGPAIADVLLGRAAPHGRLPMTFPRTVGHIPSSSHERPTGRRVNREDDRKLGRYLNSLVFPELTFGYGLTYTTFEYGELTVSRQRLSLGSGLGEGRRSRSPTPAPAPAGRSSSSTCATTSPR